MKTFIWHSDLNWLAFDNKFGIIIDTKEEQFYTFDSINTDTDCIKGFFHPIKERKEL